MPKIEVIPASEAPEAPKKMSPIAEQLLNGVNSLKKNEVLRVVPDEGKSLRGLKTAIGRVSSNHKLKLTTWDDGEAVYVKKAG